MSLLQDSLDKTERKETLAHQVLTSQVCQATEEVLASQVPQDQLDLQDLLEDKERMACLDSQVKPSN